MFCYYESNVFNSCVSHLTQRTDKEIENRISLRRENEKPH